MLLFPIYLSAQTSIQQNQKEFNSAKFEKYCKDNAISYIEVVNNKDFKIAGELASQESNSKANYLTYGISLKEEETQYFKLTGSDKVLAVQSLYRLKLNYLNRKK